MLFFINSTESQSSYAMCCKCHERSRILGNESFPRHNFHITGAGAMGMGGGNLSTPFNVCHAPHASNFEKLINFDTSVVSSNSSNWVEYNSTGTFSGECYLSCLGRNHNPCIYGNGGANCMGMVGGGGGGM